MPLSGRATRGDIKDGLVEKYVLPEFFDLDPGFLEACRLAAIRRREEMATFKSECGKRGDRDGARFFKEEEADAMKEYRAACLLLPWYTEARGDAPIRDLYEIGPELFPYLSRVERMCERT